MTVKTLVKAKTIYKSGGVERTGPTRYAVTSTSGDTHHVHTAPARCSCPALVTCSHMAAVDISIAKRHRRRAACKHALACWVLERAYRPSPVGFEDVPHGCMGGYVFIGHLVEDESGEEVEVITAVPCRRCAAEGL